MSQKVVRAEFVDFIPDKLVDGVLYICEQYKTAAHRCCCGCGEEVITPLTPADWTIYVEGNTVSMHPSIGNWGFACESHYWIKKNKVIWARPMSKQEIQRVRQRDQKDKEAYIAMQNLIKGKSKNSTNWWFDRFCSAIYRVWLLIKRM